MLKIVETRSSSNKNAEQTSNIYLSKEDIEKIKASVITNVMNVLLELIEEIISLIVEKSQILTNTNLEKVIENYRQITPKSNNTSDDVNDFFFFATKINGVKSCENINIVITSLFDVIN